MSEEEIALIGNINQKGRPVFVPKIAVTYAPIPKRAACPSETMPVKSMSKQRLMLRIE